ncbi:Asparagine-tRNA ligase [Pleurotus pulmonarius]
MSRRLFPATIHQLLAHPPPSGSPISLTGYIKSIRKQKNVTFGVLSDGSMQPGLQLVLPNSGSVQLSNGCTVVVNGTLAESPRRQLELHVSPGSLQIIGPSPPSTYPIQKQALSTEYLRTNVHLRARTDKIASTLRLRARIKKMLEGWFDKEGFTHVHTPVLTGNDCEGGGETFEVAPADFFGAEGGEGAATHLTVSAQLHLEAMAWALGRVYTLNPCFRAERSDTSRHLAEFWMLEAEWNFPATQTTTTPGPSPTTADPPRHLMQVCDTVEHALKHVLADCLPSTSSSSSSTGDGNTSAAPISLPQQDLSFLSPSPSHLISLARAADPSTPWARISYTHALQILNAASKDSTALLRIPPPEWGSSLASEHERYLAETYARGPIFVYDYPASIKPFYMRRNDGAKIDEQNDGADRQTASCFDLLIPRIGELAGGSVREERYEVLKRVLNDENTTRPPSAPDLDAPASDVKDHPLNWYLSLRKHGSSPHGGFGIGFDRLVSWISGVENVKECIPVPRTAGRIDL